MQPVERPTVISSYPARSRVVPVSGPLVSTRECGADDRPKPRPCLPFGVPPGDPEAPVPAATTAGLTGPFPAEDARLTSRFMARTAAQMNSHRTTSRAILASRTMDDCMQVSSSGPDRIGDNVNRDVATLYRWEGTDGTRREGRVGNGCGRWRGSADPHLDLTVTDDDDIPVGEQPVFHGRLVDGGAVGGLQVGEDRIVAVPGDVDVLP